MKPGIYTNSFHKSKKFTTLFPDGTGWNWATLADGGGGDFDSRGWYIYKPDGAWKFQERHKESIKKFITPFELERW